MVKGSYEANPHPYFFATSVVTMETAYNHKRAQAIEAPIISLAFTIQPLLVWSDCLIKGTLICVEYKKALIISDYSLVIFMVH